MIDLTQQEIDDISTKLYALQANKWYSLDKHVDRDKIMAVMRCIDPIGQVFKWDSTGKNVMLYKYTEYHGMDVLPEGIRVELVKDSWVTFTIKHQTFNERCPAHYKIWKGDKLIAIESIKK